MGIPVFKPVAFFPYHKNYKCVNRCFSIFTAFGLGARLDTGTRIGTLEERGGGWIVDDMFIDQPDLPKGFFFTGFNNT